ncbi:unnamed protein product [Paramecium octaurelia]|uniref:Uncharacterized protein n=1 Tax=Paramecium octaurelia TaxID=43137 RepID=A0A8S1W8B0_PAROT|nr:unnamed protein product [Paramecium octaurelia]
MDQYQPNEEKQTSITKQINTIHSNINKIQNSIIDNIPQIPQKSKVIIFLGYFENKFDSFYSHFEKKEVLLCGDYFKLVKIEKKGKISYLLYFPSILSYEDQNDEKIAQNLCISKIYAELVLKKMETCYFYLILDISQLTGDDDRGKLDNIVKDSIFYFGSFYFKEKQFFFLRYQQDDKWDYHQFSKQFALFSYFQKDKQLQIQTYRDNEILKTIFKSSNYTKAKKVKSDDQINYGQMMTYLQIQQRFLKEQINEDLKQFQIILLHLQQMPIIKNNFAVVEEVENYLKELQAGFMEEKNSLKDDASQIVQVYNFINKVNQGQNAQDINKRQQNQLSPQMVQFKEEVKIQELKIQPLLSDEVIYKLYEIIKFFQKYHNNIFKNEKIFEVQKLTLNLKQWSSNCNDTLENTLYELKYITSRIQDGPQNKIENAIYFIGITKVGKSTIINSLLNPDNIIQEDFVGQKCYGNKKETKFAIGKGGVSETQNIYGVYIGKREEVNQIFDQNEKHVFSIEEILDKEQIQKCKIPQKYFLFDCPGFDDNCNELMRIAHRISLYNYFKKTKNIIVFFVIDITQQSIENIKNTFDPITQLLKDKNDIVSHYDKWTNIILTKAKKGQRQYYLDNWKVMYKGFLDENYSFYKNLFEKRSIEFVKPKIKEIQIIVGNLTDKIIEMSSQQLQSNQAFTPEFQGVLDPKMYSLYEHCIPKVKQKLESILKFFLEDLDEYILESNDRIEMKKEKIEKLQSILLDKNTKQMVSVITYNNCKDILYDLSNWINGNPYLQKNDIFIQQYIEDMKSILKISQYCQKIKQIAPFEIKIDNLVNRIKTIIIKIEEVRKWRYFVSESNKNISLRKIYLAELDNQNNYNLKLQQLY